MFFIMFFLSKCCHNEWNILNACTKLAVYCEQHFRSYFDCERNCTHVTWVCTLYYVHAYTMPSSTEIQLKLRLYLWSDAGLYWNQNIYMLNQRMPYNAHKTGLVKKMINKFDILLNVTDQPFKIQIKNEVRTVTHWSLSFKCTHWSINVKDKNSQ